MNLESLKRRIKELRSMESDFETEEQQVDQKIDRLKEKLGYGKATAQDFQQEAEYLLSESEESRELAEAISSSESEIIDIDEKISSGNYSSLTSEKIEELAQVNEQEEKIIEKFLDEVRHLQNQLDVLENLLSQHESMENHSAAEGTNSSNVPDEVRSKIEKTEETLGDVEQRLSQMRNAEEEIEVTRRKFGKMAGTAAAGITGAQIGSSGNRKTSRKRFIGDLPDQIESIDQSQATEAVKKSGTYQKKTESWSKEDQLKAIRKSEDINWNSEQTELKGLRFSVEKENPSKYSKEAGMKMDAPYLDDVAVEYAVKNTSQQTLDVYLTMVIPSGWAYYGAMNVTSSGAGIISTNFQLDPGQKDRLVAFLYYNNGKRRETQLITDYKIAGQNNSKYSTEERTTNLPKYWN